ncbi:MAG: hypothetical protein MRZ42_05050 [Tenericutes bacterium]|nr:hypothetical protein [Mycoplasmatota bacterium]
MYRLFFFLLGFGLMVIGFTYIITYMNLISMGYSFLDYFKFIISRLECLFSIIGFIIVGIIILTKGCDEVDLHI